MNNKVQKGLKPFIIKLVIITMSICYVLGPAYHEVNEILHFLSHHLEKPSYIITHSKHVNIAFKNATIDNNHRKKSIELKSHSHEFIDFFAGILKTSGVENTPVNTNQTVQKIDKFIKSNEANNKSKPILLLYAVKSNYSEIKEKPFKGYLEYIKQPPRLT